MDWLNLIRWIREIGGIVGGLRGKYKLGKPPCKVAPVRQRVIHNKVIIMLLHTVYVCTELCYYDHEVYEAPQFTCELSN